MQLCDGKKVLTFCEVPLFCGGLDVGQEVFTAGKGAGSEVEAGLHFGRTHSEVRAMVSGRVFI